MHQASNLAHVGSNPTGIAMQFYELYKESKTYRITFEALRRASYIVHGRKEQEVLTDIIWAMKFNLANIYDKELVFHVPELSEQDCCWYVKVDFRDKRQ